MGESVFKGVEMVGTSDQSFSHAIEVAVARARQSLRNLSWFIVKEQRGGLQQGRLEYQVTLEVYFKLEAADGDLDGVAETLVGRADDLDPFEDVFAHSLLPLRSRRPKSRTSNNVRDSRFAPTLQFDFRLKDGRKLTRV